MILEVCVDDSPSHVRGPVPSVPSFSVTSYLFHLPRPPPLPPRLPPIDFPYVYSWGGGGGVRDGRLSLIIIVVTFPILTRVVYIVCRIRVQFFLFTRPLFFFFI
jgi:hypothetical protein